MITTWLLNERRSESISVVQGLVTMAHDWIHVTLVIPDGRSERRRQSRLRPALGRQVQEELAATQKSLADLKSVSR